MGVKTDIFADGEKFVIRTAENIGPALQEAQDQRNNSHHSGVKFKPK